MHLLRHDVHKDGILRKLRKIDILKHVIVDSGVAGVRVQLHAHDLIPFRFQNVPVQVGHNVKRQSLLRMM